MNYIQTNKAPEAIGPYSQGILVGNTLFTSGQLGIDPATGKLDDGIISQTKRSLENLSAILAEANMTKLNVVKISIFLKNMSDFQTVNEHYAFFFNTHKPARTTVEVSALPKSALIEIDAIAVK